MYSQLSSALIPREEPTSPSIEPERPCVLPIVRQLCAALAAADVTYCHWKSNEAIDRSASGDNDLDLLVARSDVNRFLAILARLGFKEARPAADKELPGVFHLFAYDFEADRFVHVHAHYQLVLGHDAIKNYHLPVEREYLKSSVTGSLFPLPSPEWEFVIFIIRMVLKHGTWDAALTGQWRLSASERRELEYLLERIDASEVDRIIRQHLPHVSQEVFDRCTASLRRGCSLWQRWSAGRALLRELRPNSRRSQLAAFARKWWRLGKWGTRRFLLRRRSVKRLTHGGAIIALVGADGSGKSSAIDSLHKWLSPKFQTEVRHMGKPPWSYTTRAIKPALKIVRIVLSSLRRSQQETAGEDFSLGDVLWHVVTARDRYRNYIRARRRASNGGIVLCDRFPLADVNSMDCRRTGKLMGERRQNWLIRTLASIEDRCYRAILPPDILIVLSVTPEIAVARRIDEPEERSRTRAEEIQSIDWGLTHADVIDADQRSEEVHRQIKQLIWEKL